MKIFLENVNIDSNSGPNHFGKKLKKYLENNNNECVMSAQKCDSHLCFIQSVYQILNIPLILRLDSIYFDPAQDINALNYLIHHSYKRADGVIFQSEFSKNLVFNYFGECKDYTIIRNGADLELLKEASDFNLVEVSKFEDVWSCAASWYYDPQLRQPRYRKRLSENIRFFLSSVFNISLFPEEIYFLSKMPSEINVFSIFIISICSIVVTILVSIYPAKQAAKQDPIKSLKYE